MNKQTNRGGIALPDNEQDKERRTFTKAFNEAIDRAYAAGDTEKLNSFLRSKAKQFVKHDQDALEYVMDRLPRRIEKYQPGRAGKSGQTAKLSSFATTVIRNLSTDSWRKLHGGKLVFVPGIVYDPHDSSDADGYDPTLEVEEQDEKEPVPCRRSQREWWELALRARRAGANDVQMAEMLGGKASTVRARLSRWRRKLRRIPVLTHNRDHFV